MGVTILPGSTRVHVLQIGLVRALVGRSPQLPDWYSFLAITKLGISPARKISNRIRDVSDLRESLLIRALSVMRASSSERALR